MPVTAQLDLPPGPGNVWTDAQMRAAEWRQALRAVREDPYHYQALEREEAADIARARNLEYWRNPCAVKLVERGAPCAPRAELRPQDNPHIPAAQLIAPWPLNQPAPVAVVWVTPRAIQRPKASGLLNWVGFLTPVVALIFPPAAAVMAIAIAGEQREAMNDQIDILRRLPTTAFDPTYFPQSFAVPLPLDDAQIAVREPWYLPGLVREFQKRIENEAIREAQQLTGAAAATRRQTGETLQGFVRGSFAPAMATTTSSGGDSGGGGVMVAAVVVAALLWATLEA